MSSKNVERATFAAVGAVGACIVWRLLQTKRNMQLEIVQLRDKLKEAGLTAELLKERNEAQNRLAERSQQLIHDYIKLRNEKEELKESLNKESEGRIDAEKKEKELEHEMEQWIEDHKVERYENKVTIQRLSENLKRETIHRLKSNVTRELTEKESNKVGNTMEEVQRKCIELEIDVNVKESRMQHLEKMLKEKKAEYESVKAELIIEKHEKEKAFVDLEDSVSQLNRNKLHFETIAQENEKLKKNAKEYETNFKELEIEKENLNRQQKEMVKKLNIDKEARIYIEQEIQQQKDKERNLHLGLGRSKEELQSKIQINEDLSKKITELQELLNAKTLVARPRPLLDLDLIGTNRQLVEVRRLCALTDGGALLYNYKNNQHQVVRVNREGNTVSAPCISKGDSRVQCIMTDNEDRVYIIQAKGYITVCDLQDLSKTLDTYKIPKVNDVQSGVLIRNEITLPDRGRGEIFTYNLTRREKTVILKGLRRPTSIAYRKEGDVDIFALCEFGAHRVTLYDGNWKVRATVGSRGKADGQLLSPDCVIFSPTGSLLVTDTYNLRISEFTQQGGFIRHAATCSDYPVSVSYSNGCLWVACFDGVNVKRFQIYQ